MPWARAAPPQSTAFSPVLLIGGPLCCNGPRALCPPLFLNSSDPSVPERQRVTAGCLLHCHLWVHPLLDLYCRQSSRLVSHALAHLMPSMGQLPRAYSLLLHLTVPLCARIDSARLPSSLCSLARPGATCPSCPGYLLTQLNSPSCPSPCRRHSRCSLHSGSAPSLAPGVRLLFSAPRPTLAAPH